MWIQMLFSLLMNCTDYIALLHRQHDIQVAIETLAQETTYVRLLPHCSILLPTLTPTLTLTLTLTRA